MRNRAFTLFELLVAVTIISLLLAMLTPVVGLVRERAQRVSCASSLRNWGVTFMYFAADHKGIIPRTPGMDQPAAANWFLTKPPGWPNAPSWNFYDQFAIEDVAEYMPGAQFDPSNQSWRLNDLYACPSNRDWHRQQSWNSIGSAWFPYCYFGWVSRWHGWTRTAVTDAVLMDRRLEGNRLLMQDIVVDERWRTDGNANSLPMTNHNRGVGALRAKTWNEVAGANQLWGDGHVEWRGIVDFNLPNLIANTGDNWTFGWNDKYWFAPPR